MVIIWNVLYVENTILQKKTLLIFAQFVVGKMMVCKLMTTTMQVAQIP